MKYLKKYNEELHFNPLQIGKTKVTLLGGSTLYFNEDVKEFKSEEVGKILSDDCLKLIKRDLGNDWSFFKIYFNDINWYTKEFEITFTNKKFFLIIYFSLKETKRGNEYAIEKESFQKFKYHYIYKYDNKNNWINISYNGNRFDYRDNYKGKGFDINGNISYNQKFDKPPIINEDEFKAEVEKHNDIVNKEREDYYKDILNKEKDEKERIEKIRNFLPDLLEEIKDILMEIKDFTSFSEESYVDIKDKQFIQNHLHDNIPIVKLGLHWEKLKDNGINFKANNLDDWDYLTEISRKLKQIDAHIKSLNNEYFGNFPYNLIMEVDPRNDWEIRIFIDGGKRTGSSKYDDDDYDDY